MAAKKSTEPFSGSSPSRPERRGKDPSPSEQGIDTREEAMSQRSERYYRTLLHNMQEGIVVLDRDYRITDLNSSALATSGLARDQMIGRRCHEIFHGHQEPCDCQGKPCSLRQVFDTGEPARHHHRHSASDGSERDFDILLSPLKDAQGNVTHVIEAMRDVSDLLAARKALDASETRYRDLVERAEEIIYTLDLEGTITFASPAIERVLGYAPEEMLGRNFLELIPREMHDEAQAQFEEGLRSGGISSELILLDKSGQPHSVEYFGSIIERNGRPVGIRGIVHDVTERKLAEKRLKQERDRAELYFDIAGVVLVALDTDGRVTQLNRAGCEILGVEHKDILGKRWFDESLPNREREQIEQVFAALVADGAGLPEYHENSVRTRDGEERNIAWHNRLLRNDQGAIIGTLSSGEDITERKQAESALREAEKLAATGRMAAQVAHEINNPLAGISNCFRLIKDAVPEDHPDYDMVGRIEREIARIAHIVRQMHKLHSSRGQVPSDIPVAETIQDVLAMLEPLYRKHQVAIDLGPVPTGLTVRAPAGNLQQVLYNLIVNAIQASPSGGVLSINAQIADSSNVRISIRDQGSGIPSEVRERMFEPFFSADSGDGTKEGLGLGLSIVRSIVESMKGRIEVESGDGEGTCFHVFLTSRKPC